MKKVTFNTLCITAHKLLIENNDEEYYSKVEAIVEALLNLHSLKVQEQIINSYIDEYNEDENHSKEDFLRLTVLNHILPKELLLSFE